MSDEINYDLLPKHLQTGARLWIEQGVRPGSFMQAVFANDFQAAVVRADTTSMACIREIAQFIYTTPRNCNGSYRQLALWEDYHAAKRRQELAEKQG
jgi:hypothetical protein